jgi:hypothetical protein
MPIQYGNIQIEQDLEEFKFKIEAIDMESVKEETLRRVAEEMSEFVREAVIAEPDITSPALNSPYERGPGPSMATRDAWMVEKRGADRYIVSPHPKVRQRAVVLNFGYPGTIKPKNSDYLRFMVDGVPIFRKEVEGPDETGYWQAAYNRMEQSGRLAEIAQEELEEEIEDTF